jgi:hypothetical protein
MMLGCVTGGSFVCRWNYAHGQAHVVPIFCTKVRGLWSPGEWFALAVYYVMIVIRSDLR